ncbi:MAG: hypothetical protein JO306_02825 [Gemmatimonadetes bacterium]|nr:hypothetical protein [Gemmatimonadota bacterium]
MRGPTTEQALLATVAMLCAVALSATMARTSVDAVAARAFVTLLAALAWITAEAIWHARPWAVRSLRLLVRCVVWGCAMWGPVTSLLGDPPGAPGWFAGLVASTFASLVAAGIISSFLSPMVRFVERTLPGAQP